MPEGSMLLIKNTQVDTISGAGGSALFVESLLWNECLNLRVMFDYWCVYL